MMKELELLAKQGFGVTVVQIDPPQVNQQQEALQRENEELKQKLMATSELLLATGQRAGVLEAQLQELMIQHQQDQKLMDDMEQYIDCLRTRMNLALFRADNAEAKLLGQLKHTA